MAFQLPIPFAFHDDQDFDAFYSGPNAQTVEALKDCAADRGEQLIYLFGDHGSGKSHLLQASCQYADQQVIYLPLKTYRQQDPALLQGLEQCPLVCIDDIDCIAGINEWEVAVFGFFNQQRDNDHRLIVSASSTPAQLNIQLPDLVSRLAWGLCLQLQPLTDQDKQRALTLRATRKGFELPNNVGQFLLNHYRRDLPSLWRLLDELDQESLSAKRKLTIPFVKSYLARQSTGKLE